MTVRQFAALVLAGALTLAALIGIFVGDKADTTQYLLIAALCALSVFDGERITKLEKRRGDRR